MMLKVSACGSRFSSDLTHPLYLNCVKCCGTLLFLFFQNMELTLFLCSVIVVFLVWKLSQFVNYRKRMLKITKPINLLPVHSLWGSLNQFHDIESYFARVTPEVFKRRLKVYNLWLMFFYPTFTVTHPDTVKILLKSSEPKSTNTAGIHKMFMPWLGDGLLISNGPKWERNRRLLTPAFHFDILMPYISVYNKVADIFLDKLSSLTSSGSVEVCNPVSQATLDTMLRCALSYEGRIQEKGDDHPYVKAVKELCHGTIQRSLKPWLYLDFLFFLSPEGRHYKRLCDYVHDFADNIIATRKDVLAKDPEQLKKRRLDFLDILLTAKDEHGRGLSNLDIRAEVDTFLFEGHDTTASALSWGVYCLAKYPDEQRKVYDEVKSVLKDRKDVEWEDLSGFKYLQLFMKEVMRYYTTVPILNRRLTKDTEFDGVVIPKNSTVDIGLHLMNHHPDVWPDPEEFKPERLIYTDADIDPYRFVPFSAGPRNCIGQNFAMNEIKVMIAKLVNRFSITLDEKHEVIPVPEVVMRAKYGIKVYLHPR